MPNTRYLLGIIGYLYCSNQCIQRSTRLAPVKAVEDELTLSSGSPEIYSQKRIPKFQTDLRKMSNPWDYPGIIHAYLGTLALLPSCKGSIKPPQEVCGTCHGAAVPHSVKASNIQRTFHGRMDENWRNNMKCQKSSKSKCFWTVSAWVLQRIQKCKKPMVSAIQLSAMFLRCPSGRCLTND